MAWIPFRRGKKADATIELRLGMTFLWGFRGIFVIAPILWNRDYLFMRLVLELLIRRYFIVNRSKNK